MSKIDGLHLLWWGRADSDYSRNRIVLKLLALLGVRVSFFRPLFSRTGGIEAYLKRLTRPDMIWVPCFRQNDIRSASFQARKWNVPLVVDPLISAYEKEIFEKNKAPRNSLKAEKLRLWEQDLFAQADILVADTPAHGTFFQDTLGVDSQKTAVLYVGAETDLFTPQPMPPDDAPFEILFYGSYLALQGVDVIIEAAKKSSPDLQWVILGDGNLRASMEKQAQGAANIRFESWRPYKKLPERIARAHILLGIFGTTIKANLVIPNKMFQAMAVGRPVITRHSDAFKDTLAGSDVIGWVPPGDADALSALVNHWAAHPQDLAQRGCATRQLSDDYFSMDKLAVMLENILNIVIESNASFRLRVPRNFK
ncbi:glycosyltransferase [Desulfococcaceae bacterium HSG9]|nr:glycosyltransferase [Desulfococcaceae bacterium HSG9]